MTPTVLLELVVQFSFEIVPFMSRELPELEDYRVARQNIFEFAFPLSLLTNE